MNEYKPIIGLEIHVELRTKSKMFCQCDADYFGKKPNTHVCPVCLGMPGALPVPNTKAIDWAVLIGMALNCTINKLSKFDRKHYFYPDLPKGYQISQYDEPFSEDGHLDVGGKSFGIRRVHLEEDTGKLIHSEQGTLIDFNRSSVPLVEIVTEPAFHNSEDVRTFLEELQVIIRYLDVSDADMEKGSMRLEPNISLKLLKDGEDDGVLPEYKVEVKNINSFRYVKEAIEYELDRQKELLEKGEIPAQETRGYNETKGITYSQRSKEDAHDYRYFPEPDIPPIIFNDEKIAAIRASMPELPGAKLARYEKEYSLRRQDAFILTRNRNTSEFYESVVKELGIDDELPQKVANLIVNKKISLEADVKSFCGKVTEFLKPKETDNNVLAEVVTKVIAANPKAVDDYRNGKQNASMFLLGQIMKEMRGKADAATVRSVLIQRLSS